MIADETLAAIIDFLGVDPEVEDLDAAIIEAIGGAMTEDEAGEMEEEMNALRSKVVELQNVIKTNNFEIPQGEPAPVASVEQAPSLEELASRIDALEKLIAGMNTPQTAETVAAMASAKVVNELGIKPVEIKNLLKAKTKDELWAEYNAIQNPAEKTEFYRKNLK